MRRALVFLAIASALAAAIACGSSKPEETPKPANTVDCHVAPPSTSRPPTACAGVCLAHDPCSDGSVTVTCPAGYYGLPGACENGATCCLPDDGGARTPDAASADAAADSPSDG